MQIVKKTEEYPEEKEGEGNRIVTYEGLFFASEGQEINVSFDDEYNIVTPGILLPEWNKIPSGDIVAMLTEITKYLQEEHKKKQRPAIGVPQ